MNLLHKKEITVSDLVDESYKRIQEVDDKVKAFLNIRRRKCTYISKRIRCKNWKT